MLEPSFEMDELYSASLSSPGGKIRYYMSVIVLWVLQ